jgi:hypothetical protein
MATSIKVETSLLKEKLVELNARDIVEYEEELAKYNADQNNRAKAREKKIKDILDRAVKLSSGISRIDVRSDYRWSSGYNSERINQTAISITLDNVEVDELGGYYSDNSVIAPQDPRTNSSSKWTERNSMLNTLALSAEPKTTLKIEWSESYLK